MLALGIQPVWQQHAHRENVVINSGARFQDQGGIHKGEHAVVAAGTVVTLSLPVLSDQSKEECIYDG